MTLVSATKTQNEDFIFRKVFYCFHIENPWSCRRSIQLPSINFHAHTTDFLKPLESKSKQKIPQDITGFLHRKPGNNKLK
jgi:hypothetical protein